MLLRSKVAALAGAGALLVATVAPSFAMWDWHMPSVNTTTNTAYVTTNTSSSASTGGNVQTAGSNSHQAIYTGDAESSSNSLTVVNAAVGCGCTTDTHSKTTNKVTNTAFVTSNTSSGASTGGNVQLSTTTNSRHHEEHKSNTGSSQFVSTGYAGSSSTSMTFVNVSLPSFSF